MNGDLAGGAVALGFALGLRHATDADHLLAIGTLLGSKKSLRGAVATAALWGGGHSATFLGLGLAVVAAGLRVPPGFELATELAVAAMLVGLGVARLRGAPADAPQQAAGRLRPVLVGLVHGAAGSAGVALLALTSIPTRLGALAYLLLFGAGVVVGMAALTALLALPLAWSARHAARAHRGLVVAASLGSVGLGVALAYRALS